MTNIQMAKKNEYDQVSKMCVPQVSAKTGSCVAGTCGDINQKQKAREGKALRAFCFYLLVLIISFGTIQTLLRYLCL